MAAWRHAEVKAVLRNPKAFSSYLGATQIRDPATPADLAYVRRMMLNMDPPEHSRLRRLLARAFTPRAVAALQDRISARERLDRMVDESMGRLWFDGDVIVADETGVYDDPEAIERVSPDADGRSS